MTEGVTFGSYHSENDLNMYASKLNPGVPEPWTSSVDVPYRNGSVDFTEKLSDEITYKARTMNFEFITCKNLTDSEWIYFLSDLLKKLHGKKMQIIFDKDPDYYFEGRVIITNWDNSNGRWKITMTVTCYDPFKHLISDPTVTSL